MITYNFTNESNSTSISNLPNADTILKSKGLIMKMPHSSKYIIWCYECEKSYQIINLPKEYQENGLHVFFEGYVKETSSSEIQFGPYLQLSAIY